MIPGVLAAIIAGGVAAQRRAQGKGQQQPGGQRPRPQEGLLGPWGAFVWFILGPAELGLIAGAIGSGQLYLLLPLTVTFALLHFPWLIAQHALIPLGLPRLAYYLTWTSDVTFHLDRRGGALLAAAWAIARRPSFNEGAAEWVDAKLAESETLRGAGIFASGLLLAARGDLEGARPLIQSVRELDRRVSPPAVQRLAASFLAAEAASRGDWTNVAELGQSLEGGRQAWLLSAIAQSLRLEPMAPGPLGLWLRWALAPHRRETLPLVERALLALKGAFVEPDREPPLKPAVPTSEGDELSMALSLHAAMLSRPEKAMRGEDVRALNQAWDAALSDKAMERGVEERAFLLGASGPKTTLEKLRGAIEEDLVAVVLDAGLALLELEARGAMAERVRVRVRSHLLEEVEVMSDAIRRRADEKRELPAVDEWREWSALRRAYERGVRIAGQDFRRLAFSKVHPDGCAFACWLFNDRKQRPLGNAIFRFLLSEAEALEDQRAITLQLKNISCGV